MSAFTPTMAGGPKQHKPLDYAKSANVSLDVPAILRTKPVDRDAQTVRGMQIKLASAPAPRTAALLAGVSAPVAVQPEKPVPVQADAELLHQIPGLKETLRALDSEMDASAAAEMQKRLAVHARILELQGAQLTEVRNAVEQTVHSVGRLLDRQELHGKLHEATGAKALQTEASTQQLAGQMARTEKTHALHADLHRVGGSRLLAVEQVQQEMQRTSELHGRLHAAGGAGVLQLDRRVGRAEEMQELHGKLHMANGKGLLDLRTEMADAKQTASLHSKLHKASGGAVFTMQEDIEGLQKLEKLHAQLHVASGSQVLATNEEVGRLKTASKLHAQLHGATGQHVIGLREEVTGVRQDAEAARATSAVHSRLHSGSVAELQRLQRDLDNLAAQSDDASRAAYTARSVPTPAGGMHDMRADIEELRAQNAELKATVHLHEQIHRSTTSIVKKLGGEALNVHTRQDVGCDCEDERAVARSAPSSAQLLSQLTQNIADTNRSRRNRRY